MSPSRTVTRRPRDGARRTTTARPSARRRPAQRERTSARRGRPRTRRRQRTLRRAQWWPAALVVVAVLVGLAWDAQGQDAAMATAECTLPATGVTLTAEQIANAQTIARVAHDRGLPPRAVVIALATAMQESRLHNLDHGDRDSLGLFQQRPSQGWGTPAQVHDPAYAAGTFYDHLVRVPGWQTGRLTAIAQAVQRSAYGEYYQKHEAAAVELTEALDSGQRLCG